ncbi:MAG: hypothetical protein IPJ81_09115 [Chitinophagaceae bacterium]|nr:hypothetical protein [Chitinophagaceae bacterium]
MCFYKQLEKWNKPKSFATKRADKRKDISTTENEFLDIIGAGRVIGYEELQQELNKAIELLEIQIKI